jgi:hypothetical protein
VRAVLLLLFPFVARGSVAPLDLRGIENDNVAPGLSMGVVQKRLERFSMMVRLMDNLQWRMSQNARRCPLYLGIGWDMSGVGYLAPAQSLSPVLLLPEIRWHFSPGCHMSTSQQA